jgi:hypothetical protein
MSRKIAAMAKMPLAEHDNVVKTFPPDRTGGAKPPQHVIVVTVPVQKILGIMGP